MTASSNSPDTLGALLAAGRAILQERSDSAGLDAELLLTLATGADRATLYANPDREVTDQHAAKYRQFLAARAEGRPVAYLTGEREFWSLRFEVDENALIPRPETERLVEQALTRIPLHGAYQVLELGTGSGAIAAAIASERSDCTLTATDITGPVLALACRNFARLCPNRIHTRLSDWFSEISAERESFDLILSNPPYIATRETALTDRELAFEPQAALYSGADGLDATRLICAQAPDYLKSQGWLILEHGFKQADAVAQLMRTHGLVNVRNYPDLNGLARVTEAQLS